MEKYDIARQAIDDNKIRRRRDVICVLDDLGKKPDTPTVFNNFTFHVAAVVRRTRPIVILYKHCLPY